MSDAVAKARARYIAALEDILAADPLIGHTMPRRGELRKQLVDLRRRYAEAPEEQKPSIQALMLGVSYELRTINTRIQNTASGDVQDAVRELRSLRA